MTSSNGRVIRRRLLFERNGDVGFDPKATVYGGKRQLHWDAVPATMQLDKPGIGGSRRNRSSPRTSSDASEPPRRAIEHALTTLDLIDHSEGAHRNDLRLLHFAHRTV